MPTPSNLGLCVFSTTKGNFHQTDIYKEVLKDLFGQVPTDFFGQRIAHVKDGGESPVIDMANEYARYGMNTVISAGKYKHFDQSHADEYEKDIRTMVKRLKEPFTFFLEADWLMRLPKGSERTLKWYLEMAVQILIQNPNLACMRIPHELYDEEIFKSQPYRSPDYPTINVTQYFYSLNPHVVRTSYLERVCEFISHNGHMLTPHIEWRFANAFQIMSKQTIWFGAFDPKDIRCRHIGLENWRDVKANIEKEYE